MSLGTILLIVLILMLIGVKQRAKLSRFLG
jgi:hypothetical protein